MELSAIEKLFSSEGGTFRVSPFVFQQKLSNIKAFVFDWDGVFNTGTKGIGHTSSFSEPDAMGTNLLRFSHWLLTDALPTITIITGEANESAVALATREHFTSIYTKSKNKIESFNHLLQDQGLRGEEVAFVFDDVLDLGMAKLCGLKIQIHRHASPMLNEFIQRENLADYVTSCEGGSHAVREVCELIMALRENYDDTVTNRLEFSAQYQSYLAVRQQVQTTFNIAGVYGFDSPTSTKE